MVWDRCSLLLSDEGGVGNEGSGDLVYAVLCEFIDAMVGSEVPDDEGITKTRRNTQVGLVENELCFAVCQENDHCSYSISSRSLKL